MTATERSWSSGAGSGLRLGKALGVKIARVSFLEHEYDVVEQLTLVPGAPPRMAPPKMRSSVRAVPMASSVVEAFAEHLSAFAAGPDDLPSALASAGRCGRTPSAPQGGSPCAGGPACPASSSMT